MRGLFLGSSATAVLVFLVAGDAGGVHPHLRTETARLFVDAEAADIRISPERGPPVWLRTVLEERAASATELDGAFRRADRDRLVAPRGTALEIVEAGESSFEQSWKFDERPSGSGDLVVRVNVRGRAIAPNDDGLAFVAAGSAPIRYGLATWRDARGSTHTIRPEVAASSFVLRVPAAIVDEAAFPAVLDPTISSEIVMTAPPTVEPMLLSGSDLGDVACASDGTNALVSWVRQVPVQDEDRPGTSRLSALLAARVGPTGAPLDAVSLPIYVPADNKHIPHPRIATTFGAGRYFVFYEANDRLMLTRVMPNGTVLDPNGIDLAALPINVDGFAAASNGTDIAVGWVGQTTQVLRVSSTGAVLASESVPLATPDARSPTMAWNGTNYLFAWSDERAAAQGGGVHAVRVSSAGGVLDATLISLFNVGISAPRRVSATSDGTNFLVSFADRSKRVDNDGNILDATPITFTPGGGLATAYIDSVGFDGTNFVLASNQSTHLLMYRLDSNGAQPTSGIELAASGSNHLLPCVTRLGAGTYVAWRNVDSTFSSTFAIARGARFTAAGGVPDHDAPQLLSRASNSQGAPSVAFDGTNYLVAWVDDRDKLARGVDKPRILCARVTPSGTVLDTNAIGVVPSGTIALTSWSPRVVFDGSAFLVTWRGMSAVRISKAGTVMGPPFTIPNVGSPDVAFGSGMFVAAFRYGTGVAVTRFKSDGTVLDPTPITLATSPTPTNDPKIAFNGVGFLVTWPQGPNDTTVTTVTTAGDVAPLSTVTTIGFGGLACVAGKDCLVAWSQGPTGELRHSRLTTAGTVLDPGGVVVPGTVDTAENVNVAWDGQRYVIGFIKSPHPPFGAPPNTANADNRMTLWGAYASDAGADGSAFVVSSDPTQYTMVSLAGTAGTSLFVYDKVDYALPFVAGRLRARVVGLPDAGIDGGPASDGGSIGEAGIGGDGSTPGPGDGDAGSGEPPSDSSSCGCRVRGGHHSFGAMVVGGLALALLVARKRRPT